MSMVESSMHLCRHHGDSGASYRAGDSVPVGASYIKDGQSLSASYVKEARHTHRRTGMFVDGVPVKIKFMTRGEAEELDDELFSP